MFIKSGRQLFARLMRSLDPQGRRFKGVIAVSPIGPTHFSLPVFASGLALVTAMVAAGASKARAEETKVPLTISGGHETDPKDHGRPVVLVAGALGVKPEVFREAFSGVTPARDRPPTGEEARRNKEALMEVLKPYDVTNDRLDEVSNYYRYQPQKGELWPTTAAEGYAVIEDGKIKKFVVAKPGAGYSSPPKVTVKGFEKIPLEAKFEYVKDLKKNGAIASIEIVPAETTANKK